MRKVSIVLAMVLVIGFLVTPAMAESPRPAADQLIRSYYERQGEAVPQASWNYLYDLVTNATSYGWGSTFVITNYNAMNRILVRGWVVPTGVNPGDELYFEQWLNPYQVVYINLSRVGLGDQNAWSLIWSNNSDFGSGVLLYNTTASMPGIAWEKGWYWFNP